jgi:hypothetical protein
MTEINICKKSLIKDFFDEYSSIETEGEAEAEEKSKPDKSEKHKTFNIIRNGRTTGSKSLFFSILCSLLFIPLSIPSLTKLE